MNVETYFEDPRAVLLRGDMREALAMLPEDSIDSVVTDPPYELGFMGKSWDSRGVAFDPETWRAVLRVLKPGGHLIAFGGSRTYHRIACAIEDAGFEIRDSIAQWIYGTGFPKSLDVSKAIDRVLGVTREVLGMGAAHCAGLQAGRSCECGVGRIENSQSGATKHSPATAPGAPEAVTWEGWGTALKPSHEPMVLARKPLAKGATVASSVLALGTGAINVDACRVGYGESGPPDPVWGGRKGEAHGTKFGHSDDYESKVSAIGRWPANAVFQHAPGCCPVGEREVSRQVFHNVDAAYDREGTVGEFGLGKQRAATTTTTTTEWECVEGCPVLALERMHEDAPAFFYCAKPSNRERDHGLDGMLVHTGGELTGREDGTAGLNSPRAGAGRTGGRKNVHPTVKPQELMRYYCRLVTPPGGLVLDCFAGSGSTGVAALHEGFQFLGVERDLDDKTGESLGYCEIIKARLIRALADTAKEG